MSIVVSVKDFMTTEIISVGEDVKICDAIEKMVAHNIGSIAVKRDNEFIGIVTERDVLKICCKENIYTPNLKVGKIMSTPLITVDADAPIGKATQIMELKDIRRLPVEKNGKIIGIITQKDVLRETLNVFLALRPVSWPTPSK